MCARSAGPTPALRIDHYQRVVIKIGSSLLVDSSTGQLRVAWLKALAGDIAALCQRNTDVVIVSSGAVALGRSALNAGNRKLRLDESQAAAALGQVVLANGYRNALAEHKLNVAQVLLTLGDTEHRRRYLNARRTFMSLLEARAVVVVNENDTVATEELRYGDNDRLAARVAQMIDAQLLILLSDVDGLYTANPTDNPGAEHVPEVARITADIARMAGGAGTQVGTGGMRT
jgi:glutamate 5-kinase